MARDFILLDDAIEIIKEADNNGWLDALDEDIAYSIRLATPERGEWKWYCGKEHLQCPFCEKDFDIKALWDVGEEWSQPNPWTFQYGPPGHCPSCGALLYADETMTDTHESPVAKKLWDETHG